MLTITREEEEGLRKTERLNAKLTEEEYEKLKKVAEKFEGNLSQAIRYLIRNYKCREKQS